MSSPHGPAARPAAAQHDGRASQAGETPRAFALVASPACVDLSRGQLLVVVAPGSPIMDRSQLRRTAPLAPAGLVALLVIHVRELPPDVARTLFRLPAGIAGSDDLAAAAGQGPVPG